MDYTFKPTTHGRAVIAACMALGEPPDICRVAFGSGRIGEDVNLADVHDLLNYTADGTIAERRHQDDRFYFTIQYANNEHPGVRTFYLSEFIVYIRDPETGEETDLLYGTLGDYVLPVPQHHDTIPPSIFDLPLVLVIADDVTVTVSAPPGLVTYKDLEDAVKNAVEEAVSDTGYRGAECIIATVALPSGGWEYDENHMDQNGWEYHQDIRSAKALARMAPSLAVHPESAETAKKAGICPSLQTTDGAVRVWCRTQPDSVIYATLVLLGESAGSTACTITDITIPADDWTMLQEDEQENAPLECGWRLDFQLLEVRHTMVPSLSPHKSSLIPMKRCGFCPIAESMDGAVRLWSRDKPEADLKATLVLMAKNGSAQAIGDGSYVLPMADADTLGGIKIGSGLSMAPDGTASVDMSTLSQEAVNTIAEKVLPSEAEIAAMLDEEFQPYQPEDPAT